MNMRSVMRSPGTVPRGALLEEDKVVSTWALELTQL